MRATADVVIIGGGIIGASVAFYLSREKLGNVVLVEKEKFLGSHSTAKAAGGIRAQFHNEVNILMSMLSESHFRDFKEVTGSDALFDRVGYMFLLSDDKDIATFRKSHELQRSLGLDVRMVELAEIQELAPHISTDGIKLATFCPEDGLADPHEFLTGYEQAARRMGAEIVMEAEVTGITVNDNSITDVVTSKGTISTPLVINCAGAFAALIGKMVGADIKVQPFRRQCVTTGELPFVRPDLPMVVDVSSGLYCHKESKGLLLGWADKSVEQSFDISIDPDYTDTILELALARMPELETAEVANVWAGLYETTPDHRAIIGWEPEVEGLFHVTGFSGHGLMHAPAAGLVTAEIVAGRKPSIDIHDLRPDRFGSGVLVEETNVI